MNVVINNFIGVVSLYVQLGYAKRAVNYQSGNTKLPNGPLTTKKTKVSSGKNSLLAWYDKHIRTDLPLFALPAQFFLSFLLFQYYYYYYWDAAQMERRMICAHSIV